MTHEQVQNITSSTEVYNAFTNLEKKLEEYISGHDDEFNYFVDSVANLSSLFTIMSNRLDSPGKFELQAITMSSLRLLSILDDNDEGVDDEFVKVLGDFYNKVVSNKNVNTEGE